MSTAPNIHVNEAIRDQSERIAKMLTSAGISVLRNDFKTTSKKRLSSDSTATLPSFRRITIIPEVCAAVRAPKIAALSYWLDRHPSARIFTLTTARPYQLSELRFRLDLITSRIRILNIAFRPLGAEIVFRSTELGSPEIDKTGSPRFGPHVQCLVSPGTRTFKLNQWLALVAHANDLVHDIPGVAFEFKTKAPTLADFPSYFTNTANLLSLDKEHVASLFTATFRAKLFHSLGSLADEIRRRRELGRCLRLVKEGERFNWIEVQPNTQTHNAEGAR